jgi:hypothetical protein
MSTSLQPGQEWTYLTRPGEERSRLRVLLTESTPAGDDVVHVRVDEVRVVNPAAAKGYATWIGHVPMTRGAFDHSVLELVDTTAEPPDLEGYEAWRSSGGGVFTQPLRDIISYIEDVLRQGHPPS